MLQTYRIRLASFHIFDLHLPVPGTAYAVVFRLKNKLPHVCTVCLSITFSKFKMSLMSRYEHTVSTALQIGGTVCYCRFGFRTYCMPFRTVG
jgi:hypothetical protein